MGTRVSASMLRPMLVVGLLYGMDAPALAQAPAPTQPGAPPAVVEPSGNKLIQSVSFTPLVAFAGSDLRVVVRVQPDAGNRRLLLSVDAPTFYASTERQLDGLDGARAHTFNLRELPAGEYQLIATLQGSDGIRSRVTRAFKVMGDNDALDEEVRPQPRRRRGRSN